MTTRKYWAKIQIEGEQDLYGYGTWFSDWFCRELAQDDLELQLNGRKFDKRSITLQVGGMNMRPRYGAELDGMAKFASLLLPNNPIDVDSTSILIDILTDQDGHQIYPPREVYSLLFFYIKYLSIQMKDRVDFERVCKALIRRKHPCFHDVPGQQLGTALFFYTYVMYPKQLAFHRSGIYKGNGPGTAMQRLAHLEGEAKEGELVPQEATDFYYSMLDEWCGHFKDELRYSVDHHSLKYARYYYLPLLVQDVYDRIYDGDGIFDGVEYGDDEW